MRLSIKYAPHASEMGLDVAVDDISIQDRNNFLKSYSTICNTISDF